jgi:xylulokinase
VTEADAGLEALWKRDDYLETTGMALKSPQFAVAKLRWFQEHKPEVWTQTRRVLTISDYLAFMMCGEAVGDEGTTALLGLWDLQRRRWWADGLRATGLVPEQLANPLPPGTLAGAVTHEGAARMCIPAGIPLAVGSLDHHMAAIGAGLGVLAPATESTGTVLCALRGAEAYVPCSDYCVGPGTLEIGGNHCFCQFAFDDNGATPLAWYQRTQAPDLTINELLDLAREVPPGADGMRFEPSGHGELSIAQFVGVGREPGLRRSPGHYVRAILENVSAGLAGLIARLFPDSAPEAVCATGGGARSDLWLQIKADMLGVPFVRTACAEPACLGAAMVAGVACGWYGTLQEAGHGMVSEAERFEPGTKGQL